MSELATPAAAIASSQYLYIKQAQALFSTPPEKLSASQRSRVERVVTEQRRIEARILGSRQASHVVISADAISRGLNEIAGRFTSEAEFVLDLARHGMSLQGLRDEIEHELRVEAVLEMVSAKVAPVSKLEVELFYRLHMERFRTPERRTLRHILITINEEIGGNSRAEAQARLESIRELLERFPERFAEQALRHSECPSAMQGGLLGQVQHGQLFPALEAAAFAMRPGSLSGLLESPMGFHLMRCENVQPAGVVPLATVRDRIRAQMLSARRQNKQRAWIRHIMEPLAKGA